MTTTRDDALRVLKLIDLTNLDETCTEDDVLKLCQQAQTSHGNVAAVCVWPRFVPTAVEALKGTGIEVATVVNFPGGDIPIDDVLASTAFAVSAGADEIDLVLPYRRFQVGLAKPQDKTHLTFCANMIARVGELAHQQGAKLKVILESGVLKDDEVIRKASALAIKHGADFIKTSTGKVDVNATLEAAQVMLEVIRATDRPVSIKPSGGIRTVADAAAYLVLADSIMGPDWATPETFRFGASSLLGDAEKILNSGE